MPGKITREPEGREIAWRKMSGKRNVQNMGRLGGRKQRERAMFLFEKQV